VTRNRLPSLYSDFTLQKKTNPDGYAVNVAAWEQALNRAAKRGYTSSRGVRVRSGSIRSANNTSENRKKTDHLILRTDESLLRDLELLEWGRPVALGAVFVCRPMGLSGRFGNISILIGYVKGRGNAQTYHGSLTGVYG
jgi:charged multivesicular body protein 7